MILRRLGMLVAMCGVVVAARAQTGAPAALELKLDTRLSETLAAQGEGRPLYGRSNSLVGRVERETTLEGDAEVRRAGSVIRGERLTYYPDDDEIVGVGNVRVTREGSVFTGPQLKLRIDANEGFFVAPTYYLPLYGGQGKADNINFLGPGRLSMTNATYSTCKPEDPAWYLKMATLDLDENKQEISGRAADLYFKDRRILAAPIFAFPLGDERRSGFLAPTFSLTTRSGPEILVPYYWNIAPNRDFTFYPRLMSRRGIQLGGHFRYMDPDYYGESRFEYNPRDQVSGTSRHFYNVQHNFTNLFGWGGSANLRGVSDENYFVDYSRSILASSERSLPRDIVASRAFGDWTVLARVTRYQNILDARASPPYERLPQLNATSLYRDIKGMDFSFMADATWFSRPLIASPEGARLVGSGSVSYPIVHPGWFVVPKASMHMSAYRLDDNLGNPTSLNRVVPTVSLDAGMVFERKTSYFGRAFTQTLEPRMFYVRTPYRDQSLIPVFDTAAADFNFAQLFSENTFVGNDRIADVNQLTTAVVSRLIEPESGNETLRLALGQRLYFSDQRVTIPGVASRTDTRSDILIAASGTLTKDWTFDSGLQYSVSNNRVPRVNFLTRYLPADGRIFNFGIRYQRNRQVDDIGQIDTSWRWPLSNRWMALGRLNYAFLSNRSDPNTGEIINKPGLVESVLGFEYTADCWTTRFVVQRYVTAANTTNTAFFIQLELGGLAKVGSDPFDILRRNIPGYRLPTDRLQSPSRYFGYE